MAPHALGYAGGAQWDRRCVGLGFVGFVVLWVIWALLLGALSA